MQKMEQGTMIKMATPFSFPIKKLPKRELPIVLYLHSQQITKLANFIPTLTARSINTRQDCAFSGSPIVALVSLSDYMDIMDSVIRNRKKETPNQTQNAALHRLLAPCCAAVKIKRGFSIIS
jgi:hypothetical protein